MEQLKLDLYKASKYKQRSDYTFKYNNKLGRHGWLRLTPAYSVKLVNEYLDLASFDNSIVFDPFSGTGTTPLLSAEKGFKSYATDINPFLIWFGKTKIHQFSDDSLDAVTATFNKILINYKKNLNKENWTPDIFNITRWWSQETLSFLAAIRKSIVKYCGEAKESEIQNNLIWISFCRFVIETSSAAFNHVSMSFKDSPPSINNSTLEALFNTIFNHVFNGAKSKVKGKAHIILSDARETPILGSHKVDIVITSPPYPNRISYIRELRPYMYWTKFLNETKEAGEIDWKAIGGTWGTATSNLKKWTQKSDELPNILLEVCHKISNPENKNGDLMALYVMKYFDDINLHLKNLRPCLNDGAKLFYIIGNSNFYNNCVKTEKILIKIFENWGYKNSESKIIRKRNSNKNLYEYCVSSEWK